MPYSERAYFDGDHCAHCAARDNWLRLRQLADRSARLYRAYVKTAARGGAASR